MTLQRVKQHRERNHAKQQITAGKVYHRTISQDYICSGGCQFLGNFYGAWEAGF